MLKITRTIHTLTWVNLKKKGEKKTFLKNDINIGKCITSKNTYFKHIKNKLYIVYEDTCAVKI